MKQAGYAKVSASFYTKGFELMAFQRVFVDQ